MYVRNWDVVPRIYTFSILLPIQYIYSRYFGLYMCVICNSCGAVFGCPNQTAEHLTTVVDGEKVSFMTTGCPINIKLVSNCQRCE